ncbi:signal-transduction protein containing camp-binding and cbs domains [Halogeometricum borinquense DSM 11551]|uniref:Signal-transduction protein containing camp-binding and cbs domains n=2 Tax=Halogeometricum borinquense TaxID=60847 RepID=E4NQB8_HALBP|nr:CBS domain-containing protein [Halogeometricum borinquense]ADQ67791.1 predicted signal-transduction protein containing cAMP-binding and CBS domains [Halogeometricum borinquense DSM 11551]ELY23527.1 signal-transduction protein containing camp-binding and cbs domains [Halogeometricum borinquense DSM 11551]RYJ13261.1 CBS domain-containing protein [Halogeometricum borinquense]
MPVRDIARSKGEVVSARPDTPVNELAKTMASKKVGSVVIETDGHIEGIVTDRDLALKILGEGRDREAFARDVMSPKPFTADGDMGVMELCRAMREHGVRRVPVAEEGKLSGIVTMDDLLVLLEDEMHDISEIIKAESPPYPA